MTNIRFIALVLITLVSLSYCTEYQIVDSGIVNYALPGGSWQEQENYAEIDNSDYLVSSKILGEGDFTITADIMIEDLSVGEPSFIANASSRETNYFRFNEDGKVTVYGRLFGGSLLDLGNSTSLIPDSEFVFRIQRIADHITFAIDGMVICTVDIPTTWFGEFGFWANGSTIKIADFELNGNVITLDDYLRNMPDFAIKRLNKAMKAGVLDFEPVVLPEGGALSGVNRHFGWPVATKTDDAMIVVFCRKSEHSGTLWGSDSYSTASAMVRSTDGCQTWSGISDLGQYVDIPAASRGPMRSIGVDDQGAVYMINSEGVFTSEDSGVTWKHIPGAFTASQLPAPTVNNGPKLVNHPLYGLSAFSSYETDFLVRYSLDNGSNWSQIKQTLPDFAQVHGEPTVVMVGDAMIVLARCLSEDCYDPQEGTYRYVQLWSQTGTLPLQGALTNIKASHAVAEQTPITGEDKASAFGYWSQDTASLIFNPLTQRLEAVVTNRMGGGEGQESDHSYQTLNLWSIDPLQLLAGESQWRFDGTLLSRKALDITKFIDGMHPGGSIVDIENGVQHIFLYMGYYDAPAGIYRLTRSLDTDTLAVVFRCQKLSQRKLSGFFG